MANLIRLKQIESGSFLNTAATIGQDFSQSVVDIITGEVIGVLPEGVISSSIQVDLLQTTNFAGFSSSISNSFGDIYTELVSITGSIETGLSASVATSFSQSNAIFTQFSSSINTQISASSANTIDISASVNSRLVNLETFSSSLDNGFATDAELTLTSSQIIDQGEW
jgi:hypothetical protein